MIQPLEWDSGYFGARMGRVSDPAGVPSSAELAAYDFVQACVPADAFMLIHALEAAGFRYFGARQVFEQRVAADDAGAVNAAKNTAADVATGACRRATMADLTSLLPIAAALAERSRYAGVPAFAGKVVPYYQLWLERSVRGEFDDLCLLTDGRRNPGKPAGLITLRKLPEAVLSIGIISVAPEERGAGVAARLLAAADHYAAANGCGAVQVATEGDNLSAQRCYIRNGFTLHASSLWLYYLR